MNFIRIIKFDLMNILRSPMLVIFNTIFPLVLFAGIGFVASGNFGGNIVSSYDFYGIGMIAFTAILISMTASNTFMEKGVKKGNIRLIYAPVSKVEIYLSKLISTFIFGTISYSIVCVIEQYLLGVNFGGNNIVYIILLISLLTLFGCALGIMFCCIFKSEEGANAVISLVTLVFIFFGSIFFPIGHLGKILQKVACLSPVKWFMDCSFRIIYNNDFSIYKMTTLILLLVSVVCTVICQIIFKPEEYV